MLLFLDDSPDFEQMRDKLMSATDQADRRIANILAQQNQTLFTPTSRRSTLTDEEAVKVGILFCEILTSTAK